MRNTQRCLTNEQYFMQWLEEQYPGQIPEMRSVFASIEDFCKKAKILRKPLFETLEYAPTAMALRTIEKNGTFAALYKQNYEMACEGMRLYVKYIREGCYSKYVASWSTDAENKAPECQTLESKIRAALKQETADNNYGTTLMYLQNAVHAPIQTVKEILDHVEWAQQRYGRYYYKEPEANIESEPAIKSGETVQESKDDRLLAILDEYHIHYIDQRTKGGRLWITGNTSLNAKIDELRIWGYIFSFCPGGSKSTAWNSAWYLEEKKSNDTPTSSRPLIVEVSQGAPITKDVEREKISEELLLIVSDADMGPLRTTLAEQGIVTLKQFKEENLWAFMNRFALYSISQRQAIYKRIQARLKETQETNNKFKLRTKTQTFYGATPAEAFGAFCEQIAQQYPLKIRSLIGARYNGSGSIVLHKSEPVGDFIKMMNPLAYIRSDLTAEAVITYGQWICKMCGDDDWPEQLEELPAESKAERSLPHVSTEQKTPRQEAHIPNLDAWIYKGDAKQGESPAKGEKAIAKADKEETAEGGGTKYSERAEKIVLDADLDGVSLESLSEQLKTTVTATRKAIAASKRIVEFGDKLVHEDAFVDWEDGANQLEGILDKLLDRNDGYVSASQLYGFAKTEMQMFLNDNDMDNQRMVFDMAQHLFEKVGYHEKHLSFQGKTHISRCESAVANVVDLGRNYARSHGGVFLEAEFAQYLQNVGVKTDNLRMMLKVYTSPIFLLYEKGQLMLAESMGLNDEWFETAQKALTNLFDDMGDHVILRDIQLFWFNQMPPLPGGKQWTLLLLQSILTHFSDKLDGAHTIGALSGQGIETIHAMLVSKDSEIQTFPDAVVSFLVDEGVEQRSFEAEELRQLLVKRGMITGNELIYNMPKALTNDTRFAWDADGQRVSISV